MTIKAMVLAAGFGERLRPATMKRPKPFVPLLNRPIIYYVFDLLYHFKIYDVIVNTHYLSDYLISYLNFSPHKFISPLISHEERILGTGGGVKKVQDFFSNNLLVINGDIVTYIDLYDLIRFHEDKNCLATLALMKSEYAPRVEVDKDNKIISINRTDKMGLLTYIGIQILNKQVIDYIRGDGFVDIIDIYRDLINSGKGSVYGYITKPTYWWDIGTIDMYLEATGYLLYNFDLVKPFLLDDTIGQLVYPFGPEKPLLLGEGSFLEEGVNLEGWGVIGKNCIIKKGTHLERSIIWDRVNVEANAIVLESVVTDDATVGGINKKKVI